MTAGISRFGGEAADEAAEALSRDGVVGSKRINGLVPIAGSMAGCIDLLQNPALLALLDNALGNNWVYESFGVISSFPGSTMQKLHSDSPHLFEDQAIAAMLPPFALTISIPLVDVDEVNGSTEFLPGTHRFLQSPETAKGSVWNSVLRGNCMIWDYRVRHRGQPNNSAEPRPMLYATAVAPSGRIPPTSCRMRASLLSGGMRGHGSPPIAASISCGPSRCPVSSVRPRPSIALCAGMRRDFIEHCEDLPGVRKLRFDPQRFHLTENARDLRARLDAAGDDVPALDRQLRHAPPV